MRKFLEEAKERAMEEGKIILKKQNLSKEDVQCLGEYVDIIKDVAEVCGMDEIFDFGDGYSGAPYGVHMPHVNYDGISHARGRSPSTGRFVSRADGPIPAETYNDWVDPYFGRSGHVKKDEVVRKDDVIKDFKEAYENAVTDSERELIRKLIKKIEHKD